MNWLAVDTSMNACGVAVKRAEGKFFQNIEMMERGQAERLMPMIVDIVAVAGLTLQDIDAYAVTTGPGTFTGLRVGLATVRALAQASGKPAYGVGTFDAITRDKNACIIIETKRADFYVRAPGIEDACLSPEDLNAVIRPEWTLTGDAVARAVAELGIKNQVIEVKSIPLENLISRAQESSDSGLPEPIYLRGADVSSARKKAVTIV